MAFYFDPEDDSSGESAQPLKGSPEVAQKKQLDTFKIRLHEEILRSQRHRYPFTVMRVAVNPADASSGVAGELEIILRGCIREYDLLCPVRSDEFVMAFPETTGQSAEQIALRLRKAITRKAWAEAVTSALEANIGIACFPVDGMNAEDLLLWAEQELSNERKRRKG